MELADVLHALTELAQRDLATLSDDTLDGHLEACVRLRGSSTRLHLQALAEHERRKGERETEERHGHGQRSSRREKRRETSRARALRDIPAMGDALASGSISEEHLTVLAAFLSSLSAVDRAAILLERDEIVADACALGPDAFRQHLVQRLERLRGEEQRSRSERQRAERRGVTFRSLDRDMWVLMVDSDDATGARLDAALMAEVRRRLQERGLVGLDSSTVQWRQMLHDVVVDRILGSGEFRLAPPAGTVVVRDPRSLADDPTVAGHAEPGRVDTTLVPPAAIRRLLCDEDLWLAVVDAKGLPLRVGRSERTATPAQRAMLGALYDTCAWPNCGAPFSRCEIHHVHFWERGGVTDVENLVPLCSHHHHLVHDEHYGLAIDRDRTLTFLDPAGYEIHRVVVRPPPTAHPPADVPVADPSAGPDATPGTGPPTAHCGEASAGVDTPGSRGQKEASRAADDDVAGPRARTETGGECRVIGDGDGDRDGWGDGDGDRDGCGDGDGDRDGCGDGDGDGGVAPGSRDGGVEPRAEAHRDATQGDPETAARNAA